MARGLGLPTVIGPWLGVRVHAACPRPSVLRLFLIQSRAPAAGTATARGEEADRAAAPSLVVRDPTSALEMGRRILNDALRTMVNADRRGNATALLQPISGVMVSFLNIMKHRGYIKNFEVIDPHRVGKINVELHGRIKDCKALTYRQDLRAKEIEQYRVRMLPTRQWGYVVITTPNGVLDHEEAIRQNVGGQVLGYFH